MILCITMTVRCFQSLYLDDKTTILFSSVSLAAGWKVTCPWENLVSGTCNFLLNLQEMEGCQPHSWWTWDPLQRRRCPEPRDLTTGPPHCPGAPSSPGLDATRGSCSLLLLLKTQNKQTFQMILVFKAAKLWTFCLLFYEYYTTINPNKLTTQSILYNQNFPTQTN